MAKTDAGASPPANEKITAAHIRSGLRKMFPHPEFGIVFEVAQSTGHAAHRHLDAVAMDTWPSHGLAISGIEIKVDLYDWRREKANPSKAEQIARFCDKFYIAAPPGLIPVADLPDAWGLLEGGKNGMRVAKAAIKTEAQPITREFLAAIFRASGRSLAADDVALELAAARAKLEDEFGDRVKRDAERLSTNNTQDAQNWRTLMTALGEDPEKVFRYSSRHDAAKWISVIKAVDAAGIMESWNGLCSLQKMLADIHGKVAEAVAGMHVPVSDELAEALARFTKKPRGKK